ncbi:cadherin repeat domain-containing protein, partial [Thiorhodococcus fuscus]
LDWSKLSWDIDGNSSTTDVGFSLGDIVSAKATSDTSLTIALTSAKAAALAATSGYGGVNDTLDVSAGFARDRAGNAATTDAKANAVITIAGADTTPPTTTIASGAYAEDTRTLTLTGTHFDDLLESGEGANTDIKGRLDWSKLSWDINGDDATTTNVGFTLADIGSAKVTDASHLSIVLTQPKALALTTTAGYGITAGADTLDVSAGFARDLAGNAATTDAASDAPLSLTPVVDLNGTGTGGTGIAHGASLSGDPLAFTSGDTNLALGNSATFATLKVTFATADIQDGASEALEIDTATSGGSIALNFANGANIPDVVLSGTTYAVTATVSGGISTLSFAKSGGGSLSLTQGETLLDALRYHNSAATPTNGDRAFQVSVNDGSADSAAATFLVSGDGDGIGAAEEDAVPTLSSVAGDGNGDGIVDSVQNNVTSAQVSDAAGNSSYVTLATDSGTRQTNVVVNDAPDPSELPEALQGSQFLQSVISFDLADVTPESTQRVSVYVDASLAVNDYIKQDKDGQWVSVKNTPGSNFSITLSDDATKKIIAFDIVDQGDLDLNRTPGQISDPGGAAFTNSVPVINSDGGGATAAVTIAENTRAVTTVAATDPDVGDSLTYSLSGGADQAKFSLDATSGALNFIVAPDYEAPTDADANNVYVVQITATDIYGASDTQTLNVSVSDVDEGGGAVNRPPLAIDDAFTLTTGATATLDVLANDSDPDGDTLTLSAVTPGIGTLTLVDNAIRYTASGFDSLAVGEHASDTFTYTVSDGHGGTDQATVTVDVVGADPSTRTWQAVGGDWRGQGEAGVALFAATSGQFALYDTTDGVADGQGQFQSDTSAAWQVLLGDWNGDG